PGLLHRRGVGAADVGPVRVFLALPAARAGHADPGRRPRARRALAATHISRIFRYRLMSGSDCTITAMTSASTASLISRETIPFPPLAVRRLRPTPGRPAGARR